MRDANGSAIEDWLQAERESIATDRENAVTETDIAR
jgi:hypothetical protein